MDYTQKIEWEAPDGKIYKATRFKHPKYDLPFVHIHRDSVLDTHTLQSRGKTTLEETRAANRAKGKPGDYKWEKEYGFSCTWHHDRKNMSLKLVPTDLHNATKTHVGRASW